MTYPTDPNAPRPPSATEGTPASEPWPGPSQAAPSQATPPPSVAWEPPPDEADGPAPGVRFASHGPRLVAYIIDSLIVSVVFFVLFFVLGAVLFAGARPGLTDLSDLSPSDFENGAVPPAAAAALAGFTIFVLVAIVVSFAYFPFFWARSGQTPGMRPFGLYVVRDSDGGKVSAGQAILRLIGLIISGIPLYLGYIWIFIDKRHRGWHDLIAGTVMIERKRQAR